MSNRNRAAWLWCSAALLAATAAQAGESTPARKVSIDSEVSELLGARDGHVSTSLASTSVSSSGWIDLLLRGNVSSSAIEELGGQVRTVAGSIRTVHVPVSALSRLVDLAGLEQVQAAQGLTPETNVSVPEIGAPLVWGGVPPNYPSPPTGNTGRGVVIGVIDSGIDVNHADFRTATNQTRFLWLWDHNVGLSGPAPSGFGYGSEYSGSDINAGLYTGQDFLGHGTHVLSIAAGNGRATGNGQPAYRYVGVAPEADLIAVKLMPLPAGDYADANVIDAANYIFQKAGSRPCVVLVALGKSTGPHDGQDPLDLGLSALTGPGKVVVTGAGNYGGKSLHGEWTSTASNQTGDLTVTFAPYSPASNASDNFRGEAWYNASANYDVSVVTPTGQVIGPVARGSNTSVQSPSGIVSLKNGQYTSANGSYMVELYVFRGAMTLPVVASGTWTYRFRSTASGTQRVDAWLTKWSLGSVNPTFVTGMTEARLIASPGSGNSVLSSGAYSTKRSWTALDGATYIYSKAVVNDIAYFSSPGPKRDGTSAPDVASPGYGVVGARSASYHPSDLYYMPDGVHMIDFGTSAAAAHMAGTVALILGQSPSMTTSQVRTAVQQDAHPDTYTGTTPNNRWGYGKLRVEPTAPVAVDPSAVRFGFVALTANPARGAVRFRLALSEGDLGRALSSLSLRIYDVRGREVAAIQPTLTAGTQTLVWNGTTTEGARVPSGVYNASLQVGAEHSQCRIVRID